MRLTLCTGIFLFGLQTAEAALISRTCFVDTGTCLDEWRFREHREVTFGYRYTIETAALSEVIVDISFGEVGTPNGAFILSGMFPAYKDRGRIVDLLLEGTFPPEFDNPLPPVSSSYKTTVEPIQEMCDGAPCDFRATIHDLDVSSAGLFVFGRPRSQEEVLAGVENGGSVDLGDFAWRGEYCLFGVCEGGGSPGFNSRTSTVRDAQFSFDVEAAVYIIYEPLVPIPEPGTSSLISAVLLIPIAQSVRRRGIPWQFGNPIVACSWRKRSYSPSQNN